MSTNRFIRINSLLLSVDLLYKVAVDLPYNLHFFVADRETPHTIVSSNEAETIAVFHHIQQFIPDFAFVGHVGVKVDLIASITPNSNCILIKAKGYAEDVVEFPTAAEAEEVFVDIAKSFGVPFPIKDPDTP